MIEAVRECYLEAGKIAAKVRDQAVPMIKEGGTYLEIAEFVENNIQDLGGKPAFPCNISVNEVASHYTPEDDQMRFKLGDVVKLDVGVHIDGFIADTATTWELGTNVHEKLIRATEEALENAISSIKDQVQTRAIGKTIEGTIKKYGFNPVKDLTGHSLEQYRLHAGITIPNHRSFFSQKITKDMVFAIEPFATYGKGNIKYGVPHIFSLNEKKNGEIAAEIRNRFGPLPFTRRWIPDLKLEDLKGMREYSELVESGGDIIAQFEHTVIVNEDGCDVITK